MTVTWKDRRAASALSTEVPISPDRDAIFQGLNLS